MRLAWLVLFAAMLSAPARAADVWVFLNDGRVGWGDPAADPLVLTFADKSNATVAKTAIQFQRTREEVDLGVIGIISDFMRGKNYDEGKKKLSVLGAAAVPTLIRCLQSPDRVVRAGGVYGLQFCWTSEAEEPVVKSFEQDKETRLVAMEALNRHVFDEKLAGYLKKFADDDDLSTAALVFTAVDRFFPDQTCKRLLRVLTDEKLRGNAVERLSHYLTPEISDKLMPLLDAPEAGLRRRAVVGLIAELAGGDSVRQRVMKLLGDERPDIREIAAEYFLWLGQGDDLAALSKASKEEKDVYVLAALNAALELIATRSVVSAVTRDAALKDLQSGESIEPLFMYQTHEYEKKLDYLKRAKQLQDFIGSPCRGTRDSSFDGAVEIPVATKWMPPVLDYFDPRRKSYGVTVKGEKSSFAGSVHVGDDNSWGNELRTVVAAAPGVVRQAGHIFSWGFIVIIEHKMPDGSAVCTLYAHLSPALTVKPGDTVKAGQRIGCIGRNHTVDNGGYFAHLHFGVHRGTYSGSQWICGYVGTAKWEHGDHEWVNPQEFLKANMDAPASTARP